MVNLVFPEHLSLMVFSLLKIAQVKVNMCENIVNFRLTLSPGVSWKFCLKLGKDKAGIIQEG
jgi:hypothetical protein